ncbi:MAG TPA: hypothetical protein VFU36_09485 [Jatrophihabitans sp.]|nr:hypothetical protein [Jatrophihabitans sp.]
MTEPRLIVWLCESGTAELRASYCHELRARLVQRCVATQLITLDGPTMPDAGDPSTACTVVLAGRLDPELLPATEATLFRVCFHAGDRHGELQLLPESETVATAVDRTLGALEQAGLLAVQAEDVRHDEELMTRRLYELGYL